MSGLKKRIDTLTKAIKDDVGSEILIKKDGQIIKSAKSQKKCDKVIRIILNV